MTHEKGEQTENVAIGANWGVNMWEGVGDERGIDRSEFEGGSWSSEVSECECRPFSVQVLVLIRLSSAPRSLLCQRKKFLGAETQSRRTKVAANAQRVSRIFAFASQWT